jgi:hypothetical protein
MVVIGTVLTFREDSKKAPELRHQYSSPLQYGDNLRISELGIRTIHCRSLSRSLRIRFNGGGRTPCLIP